MNFNSLQFLALYAGVLLAFFCIPHRFRWVLLLAASYWFYAQWNVRYLSLIVYATGCAYTAGMLLRRKHSWSKNVILGITIVLLLLPLLVFKYASFLAFTGSAVLSFLRIPFTLSPPTLLLPVGISFFTFQAISYVVDVYRQAQHAERHAGFLALYIAFFPQLVAGPIERASHILPQLRTQQVFSRSRVSSGLRLIGWGLFKKVVIADRLASLVEPVFAAPTQTDGVLHLFSAVAFGIQIYCDFSAYSDIAIGVSRTFGITLMRNFNNPYLGSSLSDFWRRWHISLSTWFRDYVYVPLGGNQVSLARWMINILVVFVVSGIWHGAAWTFVLWGALHGIGLVVERLGANIRPLLYMSRCPRILRQCLVFLIVSALWIPFRASSISDSWHMLTHLHTGWVWRLHHAFESRSPWAFLGVDSLQLKIVAVAICILIFVEWFLPNSKLSVAAMPKWARWGCYILLVESVLLFGVHDGSNPFIYFQF